MRALIIMESAVALAVTSASSTSPTVMIDDMYELLRKEECFIVAWYNSECEEHLAITHKYLYNHPPFGLTSRCRILVSKDRYIVHVLMREVERGHLRTSEYIIHLCSKYNPKSPTHKFCPGLDPNEYEKYRETIRFDLKSVRRTLEPFIRIDSVSCLMWSELGKRAPRERREATEILCHSCTRLRCDLQHQMNRTTAESPSKKIQRQDPSSHARLTYMSPESQKIRKQKQKTRRDSDHRRLLKREGAL